MEESPTDGLAHFVESVCGDSAFRIDEDLGDGYVRLNVSEAEKRQAAQDIRSIEDVLLELLRNSRDANSRHIFIATNRSEIKRTLVVVDDGDGVPSALCDKVFEPRVTSKLDTSHMDKWGMHGRGMALYSISQNSLYSEIEESIIGLGTSIKVISDVNALSEKTDQSTFPHFEYTNDTYAMRGPKNLLRITCEFALEHRDEVEIFFGSPIDIAATMYRYGLSVISPSRRAFRSNMDGSKLFERLVFAGDASELCEMCNELGLELSQRSAQRILNGDVKALPSIADRIIAESFPLKASTVKTNPKRKNAAEALNLHLDEDDLRMIDEGSRGFFDEICEKYYLDNNVVPSVSIRNGQLNISFTLINRP